MRIPHWRDLRRPAPLLAIIAGTFLLLALAFRGWDAYVEDSLGRWAVDELARQTDSVYRLTLGDLSLLPFDGSISFDSAAVTTDSARNARRPKPLPGLVGGARECRLSGVDLVRLALRRSFDARVLECRRMKVDLALAPRTREDSAAAADTTDVEGSVRQLIRPLGVSSLRIAEITFPSMSLHLRRPGPRGGSSLALQHARFEATGIVFDPNIATVDRARLAATGLVLRPDTLIEFSAARLAADFTDSTLSLADARHQPAIPEAEWLRRVRVRRDRVDFTLDSLQGRGVAYRAFLTSGDLAIRALELLGARLDVLSDRRIPKAPPRRYRTPQQVAAQTRSALRLDTVLVTGAITYRERKPETEGPGVVTFEQVRGTIVDLDFPSRGKPLRVEASARLMGEGVLRARLSAPLDAPDFRYELSGRLGRMPATAFNRFLSVNEAFGFDGGSVEEIEFRQTVASGRARTTVTPRYRDLSVDPTGEGGGIIGSATRGVKEFLAQAFKVRSNNPGDPAKSPRVARTVRRYYPTSTWLQFVWFSLRDGLMEVVKE